MNLADGMDEGTNYGQPVPPVGLRLPGFSSSGDNVCDEDEGGMMLLATGGRPMDDGYNNTNTANEGRNNQVQQVPHSRGKLSIDLITSNNVNLDSSYDISSSGTLRYKGIEINSAGIKNLRQHSSGSHGKVCDEKSPSPLLQSHSPQAVFNSPSFSSQHSFSSTTSSSSSSSNLFSPFSASASSSFLSSSSASSPAGEDEDVLRISPKDLIDLGVVGKGSCGVVKRAFHVPTCTIVALKSVNVHDDEKRRQMVKELRVLMALDSPYIIKLLGAFYEQGICTLMLEYMNRSSLSDALKASGPITDELLLARITKDTMEGLSYLHALHHVHRDIKPGNLLVNHEGQVKLGDLGVLTELNSTGAMASTYVGTTMFMSPERVGNQKYSSSSDIWSVGISLFYLAVGRPPYGTDKGVWGLIQAIRDGPSPNLPEGSHFSNELRHFLSCTLIKDPDKRWSARALLSHPWLKHCEERWRGGARISTPFERHLLSDTDDLDKICDALVERKYAERKEVYKRSMATMAMFDRIAKQIGVQLAVVQERFEHRYVAKTQPMQMQMQMQANANGRR